MSPRFIDHVPERLMPGRDLHIIACLRRRGPDAGQGSDLGAFGVRWASRPDLGFPRQGYFVSRRYEISDDWSFIGRFLLPNASSWTSFEADANARRPAAGPYFPVISEETLGFMRPLVRLADLRASDFELPALVEEAAAFFGNTHATDAELTFRYWPNAYPAPLPILMMDPVMAPDIIAFYRRAAVDFLLVLSLRFEYAALLGLATDDLAPLTTLVYRVDAQFGGTDVAAVSTIVRPDSPCSPAAPRTVSAERVPGTVPHPAFSAWPDWAPPAELQPVDPDGKPLPPESLVPKVPAAFTALSWSAPPDEGTLIGHGPVLYQVSRFAHGAASAGSAVPPPLPPAATFDPLLPDEMILRPELEPHFLDLPGMPWAPLEGHYRYEVRGIDLLGALSRPGARTVIRHHDDLAPPAPGARVLTGPSVELPTDATSVDVMLAIEWDATHDFNGPDAADFRVAASWTPTEAIHVDVLAVSDVDLLHADVHLAALTWVANTLAGARLSMPGSEYQIVSHDSGAPAIMRVLKSAGRLPPAGAGLIYTAGRPTPKTRVASLPRKPAVAATVGSASGTPLELQLTPAGSIALPAPGPVRIYLHLLTTTFDGEVIAGDRVRVTEPAAETAAAASWARWQALGDPNAALIGSPVLLFPEHEITMSLTPPPGLEAALLTLYVTSADAASYVESPVLPVADPALAAARGNESAATERTLSVRSSGAPPRVSALPFDPAVRTWARAAAQYAETALYDVTWDAVPGAARYQVWRAIEAGIAGGAGASDADLRDRASAQPDAFELRSDQVFGTSYTDAIPGRAPTRAVYQVRAVSVSGVPGEPSEPIGPVHVPDVRRPPAPNLVRAVATSPDEADRTIAIEWRQPGRLDDLRFEVLARPVAPLEPGFEVVGIIPRGEASDASGAFRFLHGQRTPGKSYEYRVVAVREALDPIDPAAVLRRDIRGAESASATAVAISATPLAPPSNFVAAWDTASAALMLTWTVDESYESIEVQRRPPGRWVFQRIALLPPDEATYIDPSVGSGTWAYRLRALGVSREARSAVVEVTVS